MHRDEIKPFRGSAEEHVQRLTALSDPTEVIAPLVTLPAEPVRAPLDYSATKAARFATARRIGAFLWDITWIPLLVLLCWIFILPVSDHLLNFAVIALLIAAMAGWSMTCRWRRRAVLAESQNLHRNNAAEWAMYAALLPLVPVARAWERIRRKKGAV